MKTNITSSMKRSRVCIGMLCWMMISTSSSFTLSPGQRTPHRAPALYATTGFGGGRDESSSYSRDSTSRGATSSTTVTIDEFPDRTLSTSPSFPSPSFTLSPVLSAALLITGNTVGAGILVLPELTAGPGLATSTAVFGAAWLMNVLSALVVMDLVLVDADDSTESKSTSFQDLATRHLDSGLAGTVVSGVSLLCNACVLAFDLRQSGLVGASLLPNAQAPMIAATVAASLVALLTTRSTTQLAGIGSLCVTLVLLSLGSVLGPGLLAVPEPVNTFLAPGTMPDMLGHTAPIIVMSMVFQNIVPTVVRMLEYNRADCARAIVTGSLIPLVLYVTWCLACVGGGIDVAAMTGGSTGVLLAIFALATLGGSSVCSSLSLAAEFMAGKDEDDNSVKPLETTDPAEASTASAANLPVALASVGAPLAAALFWHDSSGAGLTDALALAGSIGSPILYGVLPAIMAWKSKSSSTLPTLALPVLGLTSSAFVGHEVLSRVL